MMMIRRLRTAFSLSSTARRSSTRTRSLWTPNEQRRRLQIQAQSHADGDEEAMVMDDDYLTAMEYGMPPISGWGMGIDRVLQVLLGTRNIRDTVMFPLMRPEP